MSSIIHSRTTRRRVVAMAVARLRSGTIYRIAYSASQLLTRMRCGEHSYRRTYQCPTKGIHQT